MAVRVAVVVIKATRLVRESLVKAITAAQAMLMVRVAVAEAARVAQARVLVATLVVLAVRLPQTRTQVQASVIREAVAAVELRRAALAEQTQGTAQLGEVTRELQIVGVAAVVEPLTATVALAAVGVSFYRFLPQA